MKQYVLLSKLTGEIGLGCKIQFFDNVPIEKTLEQIAGYSITLRNDDYDAWIIFSGEDNADYPWLFVNRDSVDNNIEILSEL